MSKFTITAIIEKSPKGWFVGQLLEYPEVLSQGKTIDELKTNLIDALNLILEVNREETIKRFSGKKTIRRKIFA